MNSLETAIKHCEEALDMIKALKQQPCEDMRDATEEERKSTKDYIDSISKPTGLQFDDVYEELDFVQPHKKIFVNLQLCEDVISRESVIEWLKDKDIIKTKNQEENARRELAELPSAPPSYNSVKTELKPSDDCISRAEVLDSLKGIEILHNHDELRTNLIYGIMNLPSVTPKAESEDWKFYYKHGYAQARNDVLDKIRAEIEQNAYPIVHGVNNHEKGMTLYGILQVIDKYKESEG